MFSDSIPYSMNTISELVVLLVPQCAKSLHPSILFAGELMPFLRAGLFVSLHHKEEEFRLKSLYCVLPEINSFKKCSHSSLKTISSSLEVTGAWNAK